MRVSQIVNIRCWAAVGTLAAALWCGQARADVLEQVPSDAAAVLEIKSLEHLNAKVAKMAKTFGLDELQAEMKDPLGALLDKAHMGKGIDKSGDAALAVFAPAPGKHGEPEAVGLVPVSDYEAFLGNFNKQADAEGGEGITVVADPEAAGKKMYIAHHGKYAAVSNKIGALKGAVGIKLTTITGHEIDSKDLVFLVNMPVVRKVALPALKENRAKLIEEIHKNIGTEPALKPYAPVFDTVVTEVLDAAETFLNDAEAVVFSVELSDAGLGGSTIVDFAPDSKFGKTVAEMKSGTAPLLAGLPDRKYFVFGGASADPAVIASLANEWLNPIVKDLNATDTPMGKQIAGVLESLKTLVSATNHSAAGWIVPTKALGQESLVQQLTVVYGDAAKIASSEKKLLTDVSDLIQLAPQNQGVKTKIEFGAPKMINDVELQTYSTKMDFDANDPRAAQAQQVLAMIYGPAGMSGIFGAVTDKAFIVAQGVDDDLLRDLIASAKAEKDVLSETAHVKAVSSHLPEHRSAVYYVALDNIVSTVVRYAQGLGAPIKLKLPQNLPPVGVSIGAEGSALRFDSFVPTETVQSLIAAGIQAYTQMQAGGGGGL